MSLSVRKMEPDDVPAVLTLMRELARFEGYSVEFAVGEEHLLAEGFGKQAPFICHVAVLDEQVVGIAVTQWLFWTIDLKPTLILKELFVSPSARGAGAGEALFSAVVQEASNQGAGRMRWLVLADNEPAKGFYRRMGASSLPQWEQWELPL